MNIQIIKVNKRKTSSCCTWIFLPLIISIFSVNISKADQIFTNPSPSGLYFEGNMVQNCIDFIPLPDNDPPGDAVIRLVRFRFDLSGHEHFVNSVQARLYGNELNIDISDYEYDPEDIKNVTTTAFNSLPAATTSFRMCFYSEEVGSATVADPQVIVDWKIPADSSRDGN